MGDGEIERVTQEAVGSKQKAESSLTKGVLKEMEDSIYEKIGGI